MNRFTVGSPYGAVMLKIDSIAGFADRSSAFLFAICLLLFILISVSSGFAQKKKAEPAAINRPNLPGVVFTPASSLRAHEGELAVRFGERRRPIMPFAWQAAAPGRIEFATRDQGCLFKFVFADELVRQASTVIAGGIIDCTVTNIANRNATPVVWLAWRHAPPDSDYGLTQGIALSEWDLTEAVDIYPDPWQDRWTWFFMDHAFIRNDVKTYWLRHAKDWTVSTFVRLPELPYRNLDRQTWLGYTQLMAEIKPKASHTWQAFVPYKPLPVDVPTE